jgi:DNA polymerase
VDDSEIKLWKPVDPVPPEFIEAASDPEWIVAAFNSGFERLIAQHILAPRYGFPLTPIGRHRCLHASAAANSLPGELKIIAPALKLAEQKDAEGYKLMRKMSRPRKPREGEDPNGIYWNDDPADLERLAAYCKQDVVVERELHRLLGFLSEKEQSVWEMDAAINDRGMCLDRKLVDAAIKVLEAAQADLNEIVQLTNGTVETVDQAGRIKAWLSEQGVALSDMQKKTLQRALTRTDLSDECRRVIELRLGGASKAASKYYTAREHICADDRARSVFVYGGAHTGRFSSRGIQLQNFKREIAGIDQAVAAILSGDIERVRAIGQPQEVVGGMVRAMVRAQPGYKLVIADFSSIESRVAGWLSDQQSKVEQWAKFDRTQDPQDDAYYQLGIKLGFKKEKARSAGKTPDLAFAYAGSVDAYRKQDPDTQLTDEQIMQLRDGWRAQHPKIVSCWDALDQTAKRALHTPCNMFEAKRLVGDRSRIRLKSDGTFLRMLLPSGRTLVYPSPHMGTDRFDRPAVTYLAYDKGKMIDDSMYGGKWFNHAVQGTARDLLVDAMLRLTAAGYPIVLHIHDEIVCEVPEDFNDLEGFQKIVTAAPSWAEGLPIAAKVREGLRFCKTEATTKASDAELVEPTQAEPSAEDPPPSADPAADHGNGHDHGHAKRAKTHNGYKYSSSEADNPYTPIRNYLLSQGYRLARTFPYALPSGKILYSEDRYELGPGIVPTEKRPHKTCRFWYEVSGQTYSDTGPRRILYNWQAVLEADHNTPIYITEGANKSLALNERGLVATCAAYHSWAPECIDPLRGRHLIYLEDYDASDKDGKRPAEKFSADARKKLAPVAASFRVVPTAHLWKYLPPGARAIKPTDDVKDWLELGGDLARLGDICREIPAEGFKQLESVRASSVEMESYEWLWSDRFAIGKIGIIAGLPDEGKGQVLAYIASRVTNPDLEWPNGEGRAPHGNVILLSAEDDYADTVRPRMEAAEADCDRVEFIKMVSDQSKQGHMRRRMFSLADDLEELRRSITKLGNVKLVLVDPISAYLGIGKVDSYRASDVRAVLGPLKELAEEMRVAIIAIMHFNKKLDVVNVLLRISDSLAFGAAARHAYGIIADKDNDRTLMVRGKNNLARKDERNLAFHFEEKQVGIGRRSGKPIVSPYIVFEPGYVDVSATEAMQAASENRSPGARDEAKLLLQAMLASGPVEQTDIQEAAKANGISAITLRRAKRDLGVKVKKDRTTPGGKWFWELPTKEGF